MDINIRAGLYLDLLKRSLTNTIFESEPDIDGSARESGRCFVLRGF